MKIFDIFFGSLFLCITSLPIILLLLMFAREPAIAPNPPLDLVQVNRVQQLLIDNDPRQLLASDYQEVRLTEEELNTLITYLRNSNPALSTINIGAELADNAALLSLSIPVSVLGMHPWLNFTLHFTQQEGVLTLEQLDAGAISMPSPIVQAFRQSVASRLANDENYQLLSSFLASLHFQSITRERMVIMLDWQEENRRLLEDQARQVFVSAREAQRLLFYQSQLADITANLPEDINSVTLNDLLRPLFIFASLRSAGGASAIAENRAVFIVLSAYLTEMELSQLIGNDNSMALPRPIEVVIENREDLARHVVGSAAIAASAGATMAELLSVYKEVHDSRYRTGFSFTDIAANLSGSMLGTLASRSENDALKFQKLMTTIGPELDYLPQLGTYDGMTEEEFLERYESRESAQYLQRLQEITDSISARPFYRNFSN